MEPDRTLSALGNEYNPDIPRTADEPHSAQEFNEMLGIPTATCYRWIEELTTTGLPELHGRVLSNEHQRTNAYRREVDETVVRFEGDDYTVSVTERPEVKNKLDDVWRKITQD